MKHKKAIVVALLVIILTVTLVGELIFFWPASKQVPSTPDSYWVTVKPVGNSVFYTPAGSQWTVSFVALWSFGENTNQTINDAKITVAVSGLNGAVATLNVNANEGIFSFNYTSAVADILTFNITEVTTKDKMQFNSTVLEINGERAVGLHSEAVKVWYDSFHVSIIDSNTDIAQKGSVTFNVTYQLLPETGLTLPSGDVYNGQTFLPKIVQDAKVTINGAPAVEKQSGVFTANISTVFPTAFTVVEVSQDGWTTTKIGFDFPHNANQSTWVNIGLAAASVMIALTALGIFLLKKSKMPLKQSIRPFLGGVMLLMSSFVSLYWVAVGVEAVSHGFEWTLFTVLMVFSFVVELAGVILAFIRKKQTLIFISLCILLYSTSFMSNLF
jgi:hypothetical protein